MKKQNRLKFILTFTTLLSLFSVISALSMETVCVNHECTGDHCEICLCIQIAQITLSTLLGNLSAVTAGFLSAKKIPEKSKDYGRDFHITLVTEKVKFSE